MDYKITVTFFREEREPVEKEYAGETMALAAALDMDEHILVTGGWCLAKYAGRSVLIENAAQLWGSDIGVEVMAERTENDK